MVRKILLVGTTGSGKTTFAQWFNGEEQVRKKTQNVVFHSQVIDTPGEYLEHRRFHGVLLACAATADHVAFLHDACNPDNAFPPSFSSMFSRPVIGIINKIEHTSADIQRSDQFLRRAGVTSIFPISLHSGEGLPALREYLDRCDKDAGPPERK